MVPDALRQYTVAESDAFGETTVEVAPENILAVLGIAKHSLGYARLSTVTGVDRYPAEPRFEVVYHLQAISSKQRIRIKARVPGANPEIESAVPIYKAADWYERETFDLFGIRFLNHPDMRRIVMPEDWEGYPLRKDYPVTGPRY